MSPINDPDRRPVPDYAPPADANDVAAQQKLYEDHQAALAAQHQQDLETLQARAVDENDPRVIPHLSTASTQTALSEDDQHRRELALTEANAQLENDAARIKAARDNIRAQEEALAQMITEHDAHLDAYSKLETLPPVTPAHQLSPGEDTDLMFFPRPVQVNSGGKVVTFPVGIHHVPRSHTTHWWLQSNGARLFNGTLPERVLDQKPDADTPAKRVCPINEPADVTG